MSAAVQIRIDQAAAIAPSSASASEPAARAFRAMLRQLTATAPASASASSPTFRDRLASAPASASASEPASSLPPPGVSP